ncbi:heme/hemin ABC transporter substrate-binding protein [Methylobacterium sp. ID0610]|uniref:heme/hemin ABC transporter substrate-binding protein n=1 Tax=Methylobacterium carpenticola TaxID=3344827 RepID=UPI0036CAFDCE
MTDAPAPPRWTRRTLLAGALGFAALPRPAAAGPPARIAALGGAVTEILYRLGAADRIAAVDTTSLYPAEALREKPNVGYLRALSAEGLLSARPDLVLAAEGAGPPDVLALVREAGIPVVSVAEAPTEAGVIERILAVGRSAGLEREAAALAAEVRADFAALAEERRRIRQPARALVVLSLQNGRVMAGGRNSTADGILTLAGAANAAAGIEGFKPMGDEAVIAAAPDAVVMMRTGHGAATPESVFAQPALSQTPAARRHALVTLDGLLLLGFGPRTPQAARELMRALYPDLPRG